MRRIFTAAALALALFPAVAWAEAPDLDVWDLEPGEAQVESSLWNSSEERLARVEVERALGDRLGLELQAEVSAQDGESGRITSLSAQFTVPLTEDGAFGLAVEGGWNPRDDEAGGEAFLFATREAGRWRFDADLGFEHEAGQTGLAYAWKASRPLGRGWSFSLEGGGGEEADLAGGGVAWSPEGRSWAVSLSWFADLSGGPSVARLGLDLDL